MVANTPHALFLSYSFIMYLYTWPQNWTKHSVKHLIYASDTWSLKLQFVFKFIKTSAECCFPIPETLINVIVSSVLFGLWNMLWKNCWSGLAQYTIFYVWIKSFDNCCLIWNHFENIGIREKSAKNKYLWRESGIWSWVTFVILSMSLTDTLSLEEAIIDTFTKGPT